MERSNMLPPGHENFVNEASLSSEFPSGGGCPVMQFKLNERNPGLTRIPRDYETPHVSKFDFLFSFGPTLKGPTSDSVPVETYEKIGSVPKFIQRTLIFDEPIFVKLRQEEVLSRYALYERLSIKGNDFFTKGEFDQAIECYERALSLFWWLELSDKEKACPENGMKLFYVPLTDSNITVHNGEDTNEDEKQTRRAMVFQLLMNLSAAFMRARYFSEAREALEAAEKMNGFNCIMHFRKAQLILSNRASSLSDLFRAKEFIEKAKETKKNDKLFTQSGRILLSLNLHDVEARFEEHLVIIGELIQKKIAFEVRHFEQILQRIHFALEAREILRRENPELSEMKESKGEAPGEEIPFEISIVKRMVGKYQIFFDVHIQKEEPDLKKLEMARKELKNVLKCKKVMEFLYNFDPLKAKKTEVHFKTLLEQYRIDIEDEQILRMWKHFTRDSITEVFSDAKFNLQVYQMAVSDHIDDREKKERKMKKRSPEPKPKPWTGKALVAQLQALSTTKWIFSFLLLLAMLLIYQAVFSNEKLLLLTPLKK